MRPKMLRMPGPCRLVFTAEIREGVKGPPVTPLPPQLWEASSSPDLGAEPGLRGRGETAVLGSAGLTAWEDVEKSVRGGGN